MVEKIDNTDEIIASLAEQGLLEYDEESDLVCLTTKGVNVCNQFMIEKQEMSNLLWLRYLDILEEIEDRRILGGVRQ